MTTPTTTPAELAAVYSRLLLAAMTPEQLDELATETPGEILGHAAHDRLLELVAELTPGDRLPDDWETLTMITADATDYGRATPPADPSPSVNPCGAPAPLPFDWYIIETREPGGDWLGVWAAMRDRVPFVDAREELARFGPGSRMLRKTCAVVAEL